jgi:flagellar biosynthesis protein FlhF
MPEALERVKRALGPDAVILGTRTLDGRLRGLAGGRRVEITAARGDLISPAPRIRDAASASPAPRTPALPEQVVPYYVQLVQNDIADELAEQILRDAAAELPRGAAPSADHIRARLLKTVERLIPPCSGIQLEPGRPRRVALVGPSGGGKTTTIAKLAADFRLRRGLRVALLTLDAQRLAAGEQLARFAAVLGVKAAAVETLSDVRASISALGEFDLLLIDSPGVGWREQGRFARLAAALRSCRPDEIHLVLPASMSESAQVRAARAFQPLGVQKVIFTRVDELIGCGVILNVVHKLRVGVSYLASGQNVPNDLRETCGRELSELVFRRAVQLDQSILTSTG